MFHVISLDVSDESVWRLPSKSAFRVNPIAANCQAVGTYVLEQSTASKRAVATKNMPLFTYIYANKGMYSSRAHPDIQDILASLKKPQHVHCGAVVCAAVFCEVTVEEACLLQQAVPSNPHVRVLPHATQILHLRSVFPFAPVFTKRRPAKTRQSDKRFQLDADELATCHDRLRKCLAERQKAPLKT